MATRKLTLLNADKQSVRPNIYGSCRVSSAGQADNGSSLDEQQRHIQGRCLEQGCG
jgi:hypothetical protein